MVPGWTQFRRGQVLRGSIFAGAGLLLLGYYAGERNSLIAARDDFEDTTEPVLVIALAANSTAATTTNSLLLNLLRFSAKERTVTERTDSANSASLLLTAFLIWNYLDARYFGAPTKGTSVGPRSGLNFSITRNAQGLRGTDQSSSVRLGFTARF